LPIHREEAASTRWSDAAKLEYQKVRPSAAACGEAPPGLINSESTIMQMTMRIPTSVAGSAMLELDASLAEARGADADCGLLPSDACPDAVFGNAAAFPELGTSGVTPVGTVVPGANAFCVPAMGAAWAVSPPDCEVGV
jgi:hypothetical protein